MGKGLLLWLIGVPIPIILLLWLFFLWSPIDGTRDRPLRAEASGSSAVW